MTVYELKQRMPATEYLRWLERLRRAPNDRDDPVLWFLASLTSVVECLPFRIFGKDAPAELKKPLTFMLKFDGAAADEREQTDEELREAATKKSMAVWGLVLGMADGAAPETGIRRQLPPGIANMGSDGVVRDSPPDPADSPTPTPTPPRGATPPRTTTPRAPRVTIHRPE